MLYINIGQDFKKDCIKNIDGYFNRNKCKDWFNRKDIKNIIYGIDSTIAIKDEYLESPVFGGMSPESLSTGCKAVILLAVLDNPHIYGTRCGDNCVKYILDISKNKDITITLHHCMNFPEEGFTAFILDTGKYIHSMREFVGEFYGIRRGF